MNTKTGGGQFNFAQMKIQKMTDNLVAVKQAEFNLKAWFSHRLYIWHSEIPGCIIVENAPENSSESAVNLQHVHWFSKKPKI